MTNVADGSLMTEVMVVLGTCHFAKNCFRRLLLIVTVVRLVDNGVGGLALLQGVLILVAGNWHCEERCLLSSQRSGSISVDCAVNRLVHYQEVLIMVLGD